MSVAEILRRPYARVIVPEPDGTFRAEIVDFPGCIASGDTQADALAALENVAASWLEATLERKQAIPEPSETVEFSGRLVLRLPKALHAKAAYAAKREGVSLNQFIVTSVAEQVGSKLAFSRLERTVGTFINMSLQHADWQATQRVVTTSAVFSTNAPLRIVGEAKYARG
jgi:predicted HicB family RNase H-like nuclease